MARWRAPGWMLWVMLAGCGPTAEFNIGGSDKSASDPIIGGTLDSNDGAVVALARRRITGQMDPFCSGSLIAPSTVMTAAHCVNIYGSNASYAAVFGSDASKPTETVEVVRQIGHPDFDRTGQLENDVALFQLQRAVISVAPLPLNTTPLTTADIGRNLRHVGFGVYGFNPDGSSNFDGKKRTGEQDIQNVLARTVESNTPGSQTCMGDSGGPGLLVTDGNSAERIAGLVSYGDANCARYGADTRIDVYAPWIQVTYADWEQPGCQQDSHCQSGCTPQDPDCLCAADGNCNPGCPDKSTDPDCHSQCGAGDGCSSTSCAVPDPDCKTVGAACNAAASCKSRQCLSDPQRAGYCSAPCVANSDCPTGMRCTDSLCMFPDPQAANQPILLTAADVSGRAAIGTGCSAVSADPFGWEWALFVGIASHFIRCAKKRRHETAHHQRG